VAATTTRPFAASSGRVAEPSIAIDPTDPDHILAAAMIDGHGLLISWSSDGGSTWATDTPGGIPDTRADPSVAIRRRDGLWIVSLVVNGTSGAGLTRVAVMLSSDEGANWTSPDMLDEQGFIAQDLNKIAVDNNPESPGYGDIYLVWNAVDYVGPLPRGEDPPDPNYEDPRIEVYHSDYNDTLSFGGAEAWTSVQLGRNLLDGVTYQHIASAGIGIGVAGEVYVAACLLPNPPAEEDNGPRALAMAMGLPDQMNDHGAVEWSDAYVAIPNIVGPWDHGTWPDVPNWGTVITYPVISVDHSPGPFRGTVYLSWVEHVSPAEFDVRVVPARPAERTAPAFDPADVRSVGSIVDNDQFTHWAACDPESGALGILYNDRRNDSLDSRAEITLSVTRDQGLTWSYQALSAPYADPTPVIWHGREYIGIDAVGGIFGCLWADGTSGDWDTYFAAVDVPPVATAPGMFVDVSSSNEASALAAVLQDPQDPAVPSQAGKFDANADGYPDLLITTSDGESNVLLFVGNEAAAGVEIGPLVQVQGFVGARNTRGFAVTDLDHDGREDVFIAAGPHSVFNADAEAYLYRNVTVAVGATPTFVSISSDLTDGLGAPITHAWGGAFGDANADGFDDLYIATCESNTPTPEAFDGNGKEDVYLESKADQSGWLGFSDRTLDRGFNTGVTSNAAETVAARWADVDDDGDLDLFVSWLGPLNYGGTVGWSPLYINDGEGQFSDATQMDPTNPAFTGPRFARYGSVSGAEFEDMNSDGVLDIVLARQEPVVTGGEPENLFVVLGDPADPGAFVIEETSGLHSTKETMGIAIDDLNGDGYLDVLGGAAEAGNPMASLLSSTSTGGTSYVDQSEMLGMPSVTQSGLTAADLNQDGDTDLFIGAASGFLWANKTASGAWASTNTLTVEVTGRDGIANPNGTGALVTVEVGGSEPRTWSRHIDSGSGHGGGARNGLYFGIPGVPGVSTLSPADVTVRYADGATVSVTGVDPIVTPNLVVAYPDMSEAAGLTNVQSAYVPTTGYTAWEFTWETTHPSVHDVVLIKKHSGIKGAPYTGPCEVVPSGDWLVLDAATMPAVRRTSRAIGNDMYLHTVTWSGPMCVAPCTYEFMVRSWKTSSTMITSGLQQLSIPLCADIQG